MSHFLLEFCLLILSATEDREDVSRDRGRSSLRTTGTLTLKKLDLQRRAA